MTDNNNEIKTSTYIGQRRDINADMLYYVSYIAVIMHNAQPDEILICYFLFTIKLVFKLWSVSNYIQHTYKRKRIKIFSTTGTKKIVKYKHIFCLYVKHICSKQTQYTLINIFHKI